jgi:hypothetical protein
MTSKQSFLADGNGNSIAGQVSAATSYAFDFLNRITQAASMTESGEPVVKKYLYDDASNILTTYSLLENAGTGGEEYLPPGHRRGKDGNRYL